MTVDQDINSADPAKDPAVVSARAKRLAELHAEFDEYPGPGLAVGAAVAVGLIALIVALTVPLWLPVVERRFDAGHKSLEQRIVELEARPNPEARVTALESRLNSDISTRISSLETRTPGDLVDRLNRLETRLEQINTRVADLSSKAGLPPLTPIGAAATAALPGTAVNPPAATATAATIAAGMPVPTPAAADPMTAQPTPAAPMVAPVVNAPNADWTQRLIALEAAQAKLSADLARVQPDIAGGIAADGAIEALRRRINDLDRNLTNLVSRVTGQEEQLDGQAEQLGHLRQSLAKGQASDTARAARILAVGQLRQSIERGQPFAGALTGVRQLIAGQPGLGRSLDALDRTATTGIATVPDLANRLHGLVAPTLAAARQPGDGFVDQAMGRLGEVVVIRRTGERAAADPESLDAKLDRALTAVDSGNLQAARDELTDVGGPAAQILAPWLNDVSARLNTVSALDALANAMMAEVESAASPASHASEPVHLPPPAADKATQHTADDTPPATPPEANHGATHEDAKTGHAP